MTTTYKGHTITETNTTTDTARGIRNVFAIEGEFGKAAARRPFLTSIKACREYINETAAYQASRGQEQAIE